MTILGDNFVSALKLLMLEGQAAFKLQTSLFRNAFAWANILEFLWKLELQIYHENENSVSQIPVAYGMANDCMTDDWH